MLKELFACWWASSTFKDYKPERVTFRKIKKWLDQFPRADRKLLIALMRKVIYLSEHQTLTNLARQNRRLLKRLKGTGLGPKSIIYMQIDSAGSSSPMMLNLLRDSERLEQRGCIFLDSNDISRIKDKTYELGEGAIVYVDDFIGTGRQFRRSQKRVSEFILGNLSEFLVSACICEEAIDVLGELGVEPMTEFVHLKSQRPLHHDCLDVDTSIKNRLIALCQQIHPQEGLGFKKLATMVSIYRNSPNTMPLVLRGSKGQAPFFGILPRTTDLPIP